MNTGNITGCLIDTNGNKHWYKDGKQHREDGPAVEKANGDKFWYKDGKLHREDGPAVEWTNGDKEWYKDGKRHREDDPAIEYTNGDKEWYRDGLNYTPEAKPDYDKLKAENDELRMKLSEIMKLAAI